jgi:uncharacterized protein YbbK (DUF523 family)
MKACRKIITYKCPACGSIYIMDGTDKVSSTCTFKQRSNAFRSGFTPSCGHKLVKQGEIEDCKKRGAKCS